MRTERPAASTVTASSLRPPERHGHAQRQRLNVVPPSLWYEQSHVLAQHTLPPSSLSKLWECVKIRRPRIHPAAVCRQPTLVWIHVLVVRWAVQPNILGSHNLAQQVVVGVCVQGGDRARGSQPGVDRCHFASAKHTVLWRLHKHHTDINRRGLAAADSSLPHLDLEQQTEGLKLCTHRHMPCAKQNNSNG